jgi:nucleoside-specific outer membrane channel protein Tsx
VEGDVIGSSSASRARVLAACALWLAFVGGSVAPAQRPLRDTTQAARERPGAPRISTTEAQLLATLHQPGAAEHWVITLQHFSTWTYGSNFFFLDASAPPKLQFFRNGLGLYLEYAPVVSLSRLTRAHVGVGRLADVGGTLQLNGGHTPAGFEIPRVFLEGVDLAWTVPGVPVFNTQLMARQERTYDPSWQFTWIYAAPFAIGRTRWLVQGFMDVWRRARSGAPTSTVVLAQPQILLHLASSKDGGGLDLGVELEPSHDYPVRAVHQGWQVAYSPMLRWVF